MNRRRSTAQSASPAGPPLAAGALDIATLKWRSGATASAPDSLAIEEPLEIRLGGRRFTVTMRTPGHDEELAAGFLLAEGFIEARDELAEIRRLRDSRGALDPNAIDVVLKVPATRLRQRLKRNFVVSSSCGVCGKASIEAITRRVARLTSAVKVSAATLGVMVGRMGEAQEVFVATGGLHAAALFDSAGLLRVVREDVGRHNAVDKVVGYALLRGILPLSDSILMVSGRLSFEIVQKAAAAGVPVLAGISAPSSLAVQLAEEVGMTLVGFLRDSSFNLYTQPSRIILSPRPPGEG